MCHEREFNCECFICLCPYCEVHHGSSHVCLISVRLIVSVSHVCVLSVGLIVSVSYACVLNVRLIVSFHTYASLA